MRNQQGISLSERAICACLGALFGALIGAALVWLFGVFSQTMGPGDSISDPLGWIYAASAVLAVYGFITGSHVGTLIGHLLSALFEFERQDREHSVPTWLAVVLLVGLAFVVWRLSE